MDEQCGSMFGKGCADATFSLKAALETLREQGINAHVLFIDLVKAYDSVNRELLGKVLNIYGVPQETITVLKKLHKDVTYILPVGEEKVEIEASVGVKQGDNLGPILFIYLIQAVSQTLDREMKKINIKKADFKAYTLRKTDGLIARSNPSLGKATRVTNKGTRFSFTKSFFVDDAALLFLRRTDIEKGGKLAKEHFRRFGLTIHCGDKTTKAGSKTEAMFFPGARKKATEEDTADIMVGGTNYFSYCDKFKYLGTIFTPNLKNDEDIKKRISQATGAFAAMEKTLCNQQLQVCYRIRIYEATVLNILLWGCESWALTVELRRNLEVCHHRFLRRMAKINIYDVMEHHISNDEIREKLGHCKTIHQAMELKRAKWLQKLATWDYNRNPRKLLKAWYYKKRRPIGRPQQTIKKSLSDTLTKSLGISENLNDWMDIAMNKPLEWNETLQKNLNLTTSEDNEKHRPGSKSSLFKLLL